MATKIKDFPWCLNKIAYLVQLFLVPQPPQQYNCFQAFSRQWQPQFPYEVQAIDSVRKRVKRGKPAHKQPIQKNVECNSKCYGCKNLACFSVEVKVNQ